MPGTAAARLIRLCLLLTAIAADTDRPLWALPWTTGEERRRILVEWGGGAAPATPERKISRREPSQEQAARTPGAIAVSCAGESLSYAELDARAGRLAIG
ncbi:Non-ribosomal peptide synthetase OS=Streptomyces antimycoticus OX=68175 GN=SANT12839_008100 PE=4 SV=1 [Streptomyces antimycoticus]